MIKNLLVVFLSYINRICNIEAKCSIIDITTLKKIDSTGNTVDCAQVIRALTKEIITKIISAQLKS